MGSMRSAAGGATQDEAAGAGARRAREQAAAAIDLSARRYDYPGPVALSKAYIVASTPRSGAAWFCANLWQTGVLGAPADYLGYPNQRVARRLARRLDASSATDYLAKVLGCRTSGNGIFGTEAYFKAFTHTLGLAPEALSQLTPVTYIYFERRDHLAQAVSMARFEQTRRGALEKKIPPQYERDLISKYLGVLERAQLSWTRWFEENGIDPFVVTCEDFVAHEDGVVGNIVDLLGVRGDAPEAVRLPRPVRPPIGRIDPWATRFEHEIRMGVRPGVWSTRL